MNDYQCILNTAKQTDVPDNSMSAVGAVAGFKYAFGAGVFVQAPHVAGRLDSPS